MPEIRPNQVTLEARRKTAALLETKLSQPIAQFDDLIDRLQLALVADLDPALARRAGEQVLRAAEAVQLVQQGEQGAALPGGPPAGDLGCGGPAGARAAHRFGGAATGCSPCSS